MKFKLCEWCRKKADRFADGQMEEFMFCPQCVRRLVSYHRLIDGWPEDEDEDFTLFEEKEEK